ncbi:hypothetical protein GDO81_023324 [Engystomops pustulosus]|uniref:Uncharacterized protein n=1 Tax=Engystomops pustulosus TaxID=76066 RepID=A0AAV6YSZ9_ENGPU|nr:hypothetical protein GDO81_023324 [Engystomops pustulosus]
MFASWRFWPKTSLETSTKAPGKSSSPRRPESWSLANPGRARYNHDVFCMSFSFPNLTPSTRSPTVDLPPMFLSPLRLLYCQN